MSPRDYLIHTHPPLFFSGTRFKHWCSKVTLLTLPFKRYRHIASILIMYGFEITVLDLIPRRIRKRLNIREPGLASLDVYRRFRLALQDLGPVFVKFGQILSTRTELMPPELIKELKMLVDK